MSKLREQVIEFHRANDLPGQGAGPVAVPSADRVRLRLALITEEYLELLDSFNIPLGDEYLLGGSLRSHLNTIIRWAEVPCMPDVADALADLDYVIEGTRLEFGIDGGPIADEIHRSNMSKLGADGKPVRREDGKILKGPNYEPPDVEGELRKQGWTP